MTKIAMFQENAGADQMTFRAVAVGNQAVGRTAGEALDALTTQLPDGEADTLIIVRSLRPDRLFTAAQRQSLEQLMARWRSARAAGESLAAGEQIELKNLIDAEVHAATERAPALSHELAR
ncbi:MAG: hypothetical protein ACHRXM_31540 [Isosphaerales bacterium]